MKKLNGSQRRREKDIRVKAAIEESVKHEDKIKLEDEIKREDRIKCEEKRRGRKAATRLIPKFLRNY